LQPGYLRIEKPLFSYDQLMWLVVAVAGLLVVSLAAWRFHRTR
jgi:Co/Zn/Cd efflux system component